VRRMGNGVIQSAAWSRMGGLWSTARRPTTSLWLGGMERTCGSSSLRKTITCGLGIRLVAGRRHHSLFWRRQQIMGSVPGRISPLSRADVYALQLMGDRRPTWAPQDSDKRSPNRGTGSGASMNDP